MSLEFVVGVDTHVDTHTAVITDLQGALKAHCVINTDLEGYGELLSWAQGCAEGATLRWAIEGTRHYGLGLVRFLVSEGQEVHEIERVKHLGKRRAGKSDEIDALRAARELLARQSPSRIRCDGDREALRILKVERDSVVDSLKRSRTILSSLIITAPDDLRSQLRSLGRVNRARFCAGMEIPTHRDIAELTIFKSLKRIGQRIIAFEQQAKDLEDEIAVIVDKALPGLVKSEPGIGHISALQIYLSWSHAGRIRNEAAFAMLSGTAPIPVSSGRTHQFRLNRMGDRGLNSALHTIATNRMIHHKPTRDYVERRQQEGKTKAEIRRCIKRYLARHLFRELTKICSPPKA